MPRLLPVFITLLAALVGAGAALAQPADYSSREAALKGLADPDAAQRARAITWIANHGGPEDEAALQRRLTDESPFVRGFAEQGLWLMWGRSGDKAIDEMMAKGVEQMQARQFTASIATFSEVIRRKPDFAEGWNRRATVLYLAGDFKRSLADCDQVIRRKPQHFGALAGYGQIYFELEEYERAIEYWKRALEANPNMLGVELNIKGAEQLIAERRKRAT